MARRGPRRDRDQRYRAELLTAQALVREAIFALDRVLYPHIHEAIEQRVARKRRRQAAARRKRQAEAWLRRQLDGLGKR